MTVLLINMRSSSGANSPWNNLLPDATTPIPLMDATGQSTARTIHYDPAAPSEGDTATLGSGSIPVTGDGAWANEASGNVAKSGHRHDGADTPFAKIVLNGPPNTAIVVDVFGLSSEGRFTDVKVNGGPVEALDNEPPGTSLPFSASTNGDGDCFIEYTRSAASSGFAYVNAIRVTVVPGPELTLDTDTLTPGSAVTGTYAGLSEAPSGTIRVTDSQGVQRDYPGTFTNDATDGEGKHSGDWSIVLPDVPANVGGTADLFHEGPITIKYMGET